MTFDFLSPSQYFHEAKSRPRKRFGQHFLEQQATAERIVQSAELSPSDTAVEIGPGLGALTRFILPKAGMLHLIEVDTDMTEYLRERIPDGAPAVIHEQDVLSFDFAGLARIEGKPLVLLGNLPYNITSPLLFHLLDSFPAIGKAVFMMQKEVGARLAASPGTKDYGVLTVLLGMFGQVRVLFTVGPGQFYPPPKVDSIVLRIAFAGTAPEGPSFGFLRKFVSKAFQQRRKTLGNSLKGVFGLPAGALSEAFEKAIIDPGRRAETLTSTEFLALATSVSEKMLPRHEL